VHAVLAAKRLSTLSLMDDPRQRLVSLFIILALIKLRNVLSVTVQPVDVVLVIFTGPLVVTVMDWVEAPLLQL
jgi:hypothetical protein